MPPVHLCNQGDRIGKLENLLDPETGIVMDKLKTLEEGQRELKETMQKFIDSVDKKFVKKETFAVAVSVLSFVALVLGILAYVFNK